LFGLPPAAVHRRIGIIDQILRRGIIGGVGADADAGGYKQLLLRGRQSQGDHNQAFGFFSAVCAASSAEWFWLGWHDKFVPIHTAGVSSCAHSYTSAGPASEQLVTDAMLPEVSR
jgi:hypothetical protein